MAVPINLKLAAEIVDFAVDAAVVGVTPDLNPRGAVPILHRITVLNAATGDVDVFVEHRIGIINVWVLKQSAAGGAGDSVQVTDGDSAAITEAMSLNVADKAIVRAASIDDATGVIPAGGTLRVKRVKASAANVRCTVFVLGVRI